MVKVHKIKIKNSSAAQGRMSTGLNTEVYLDGKRLKGVKSFRYALDAKSMATVTMEIYAEVELEARVVVKALKTLEEAQNEVVEIMSGADQAQATIYNATIVESTIRRTHGAVVSATKFKR